MKDPWQSRICRYLRSRVIVAILAVSVWILYVALCQQYSQRLEFSGNDDLPRSVSVENFLALYNSTGKPDAGIIIRHTTVAALMVFFWFSFCFGQLEQLQIEKKWARTKDATGKNVLEETVEVVRDERKQTLESLASEEEAVFVPTKEEEEDCERKSVSYGPETKPEKVLPKTIVKLKEKHGITSPSAPSQESREPEERNPERSRTTELHCERIAAVAMPGLTCGSCNASIEASWKFCSSCGYPVNGAVSSKSFCDDISLININTQLSVTTQTSSEDTNAERKHTHTVPRHYKMKRSKSFGTTNEPRTRLLRTKSLGGIVTQKSTNMDKKKPHRVLTTSRMSLRNVATKPESSAFVRPKALQRLSASTDMIHKTNFPFKDSQSVVHRALMENLVDSCENSDVLSIKFRKTDSVCIGSRLWPLSHLVSQYPPQWGHRNKQLVAVIASVPREDDNDGWIRASRWSRPSALPKNVRRAKVYVQTGSHSYNSSVTRGERSAASHWHLNFAGNRLFCSGKGSLVDEEELHIMEYPSLASLALAISDAKSNGVKGLSLDTYDSSLGPTPILIKGAQRTCSIDSAKLDLNEFSEASDDQIRAATTQLEVPTSINIVTLPTVTPTQDKYTIREIRRLFIYAYTGFRAVVLESGGRRPVLHTSFWCCDQRNGGNKGLLAAIQIIAAGTAGIKYLHFTPGNNTEYDRSAMQHGICVANALHGKHFNIAVGILAASGYTWRDNKPSHLPYQPPSGSIWTN